MRKIVPVLAIFAVLFYQAAFSAVTADVTPCSAGKDLEGRAL